MKLTHPRRGRVVEADENKAARLRTQGWVDVESTEGAACPTCGAAGDDTCVTASGNETSPHANRP